MTPTETIETFDALTARDIPTRFDVTKWPSDVEAYLGRTENPFHRAMLKNYFRHLLLEVSGYWDQIIVPELTIAEPVYRVGDRRRMLVLTGKEPVEGFYRTAFETRVNVMGARTMNMCVEDFGVTTEAVWTHVAPGAALLDHEFDVDPDAYYLMTHNLFQIFSYTKDAILIGERIYDDPESYSYERLDPADVITPELARQQLAPYLQRATLD